MTQIKRRLAERAGLDPGLLDRDWFERVVQRRVAELGLASSRAYCEQLGRDAGELQRLAEQVSVTETWFFRYPESFSLLLRHLKGLRSAENAPSRLKMLSVACATGQEPYSMAITAAQAGWPLDCVILDALDRNENAIQAARQGEYPRRTLRDGAPDWARPWLHPEGDYIHVAPQIKAAVRWIVSDVLQPLSSEFQGSYDVIFCRNVLIYLHATARAKLVDRISDWLSPTGLLFVGHAERVEALRDRFLFVAEPHTFALHAREPEQPAVSDSDTSRSGPIARSTTTRARPDNRQRNTVSRADDPVPQPPTVAHRPTVDEAQTRRPTTQCRGEARALSPTNQPTASTPTLCEAIALADGGDLGAALRAVETVIEEQAPNAQAFTLLGNIHLAQENLLLARQAFTKSLYLDAHCEETLLQMAMIYQRLGNQPQAARYRRRAAQAHRAGNPEETQ